MTDLSTPHLIEVRLAEIENDLAVRQNSWESAARVWFRKLREVEKDRANAYVAADGSPTEKREAGSYAVGEDGGVEQAEYEALRAVVKVLEARAMIGMALLKSQGRVSV